MATEIILKGCAPTPIANYLKALGIMRIVSEQSDPDAAGRWTDETFILKSVLDSGELESFFIDMYKPTPLISPWNGGSGFYFREEKTQEKDEKTGKKKKTGKFTEETTATRILSAFLESGSERLEDYRKNIATAKRVIRDLGLVQAPGGDGKKTLLTILRGILGESALLGIDAGICISDKKPEYAPLTGTGWNDGNMDFTSNFMQRIQKVINLDTGRPTPESRSYLTASLFGSSTFDCPLKDAAGQFFPGIAGGYNNGPGFSSDSIFNPWDYILMMEGIVVLRAAATKRLESGVSGTVSFPFSVRSSGSGSGSSVFADEESSRNEIWLPLWKRFADQEEIRALFSEGRVTLKRKNVTNGVDFARALASFGMDRGISEFQRFGFLKRFGKNYFATPLSRMGVKRNPDIDLINDLDKQNWLNNLRRYARKKETPGKPAMLVRNLEEQIFKLAGQGGPSVIQEILSILGEIQHVLGISGEARDSVRPLHLLSEEWIPAADDGSVEFRVALALSGIRGTGIPIRYHLSPLGIEKGKETWKKDTRDVVWGAGSLSRNLTKIVHRRMAGNSKSDITDKPFGSFTFTTTSDVSAFLFGKTDDTKIGRLLGGLCHVRYQGTRNPEKKELSVLPAGFECLKLLFSTDHDLKKANILPDDKTLKLPREIVALLADGDPGKMKKALEITWRRLKTGEIPIPSFPKTPPEMPAIDGRRVLSALLIPIGYGDVKRIGKSIMKK